VEKKREDRSVAEFISLKGAPIIIQQMFGITQEIS
jgi:hypothetical protein